MNDFNFENIEIPAIARGEVLPHQAEFEAMKQKREEYLQKQQRRHDWKIAIFGVVGGGVMGLLTSLLFWLITV